ncbi:MAG: hypothetical protein IPJ34_13060 [Myxococcales bacterium]|nr:hypothetical protein [Myxococcales bacterium]
MKLFSEPWDSGEHGYRLKDFPLGISRWNGKFRDGGALLNRPRALGARARLPSRGQAISS